MIAYINERGDAVLKPENDAERYILLEWTKRGIWIKSWGWVNVGGGERSRFESMVIGPHTEKESA